MFAQLKLYAAYFVGGLILVLSLACGAEYLWIEHQNAELKTLNSELDSVRKANADNLVTIMSLTTERDKAARTCEDNLQGYSATLAYLKQIDATPSANDKTPEASNENPIPNSSFRIDSDDPLLNALNSMFLPQAGDGRAVCKAARSNSAAGSAALPGPVLYCFCSDNDVRNLLKNQALDDNRMRGLERDLDGLR